MNPIEMIRAVAREATGVLGYVRLAIFEDESHAELAISISQWVNHPSARLLIIAMRDQPVELHAYVGVERIAWPTDPVEFMALAKRALDAASATK